MSHPLARGDSARSLSETYETSSVTDSDNGDASFRESRLEPIAEQTANEREENGMVFITRNDDKEVRIRISFIYTSLLFCLTIHNALRATRAKITTFVAPCNTPPNDISTM